MNKKINNVRWFQIIVFFILLSCTTKIKRENYNKDIADGRKVCESFLSSYTKDVKASYRYISGVDYRTFLEKTHKSDSILGVIVNYSFIKGESYFEKNGESVSGSYEIKFKVARKEKNTIMSFSLEIIKGAILIVGSNENFEI